MKAISLAVIVVLVIIVVFTLWALVRRPGPPPPPSHPLTIYGAGNDKATLYEVSPPATAWQSAGALAGVYTLAFNSGDGMLYGIDQNLALQRATPGQAWAPVPNGDPSGDKLASVAFDGTNRLWGVTINGALVLKGANPDAPWTQVQPAIGNTISMIDFDANGVMYGVSRTVPGNLYKKASADPASAWSMIPSSGVDLYDVKIDRGTGVFYAVGGSYQLYSSPDPTKTPWAPTPVSNAVLVQGIAVASSTGH